MTDRAKDGEHALHDDSENDMHDHAPTTSVAGEAHVEPDQTVGKRPQMRPQHETPEGDGMSSETGADDRPVTTSTPAGTLGAPVEEELKRDPAGASERTDPVSR